MKRQVHFEQKLTDYALYEAESKREYNRRLFRVVATRYDAVTKVLSFGNDRRWKAHLLRKLEGGEPRRIVDIACGTGDLTYALAAKFQNAEVHGVDLSPEMLARARRRGRGKETGHLRFSQGDMQNLPYPAGFADIVTGGYALRNAPELKEAVAELRRVLRPGGRLGILDFSRSDNPALSRVQVGVLRLWGRIWGRLLHGNPEVYGYIAESLRAFPPRRRFEEILRHHGFRHVRSRTFFWGLIAVTVARG